MKDDSVFLRLCRLRRSVRRFDDRPVEHEKLEACLEAARLAPSADNVQPWRFVVFDDRNKKAALARAAFSGIYSRSSNFGRAPVLVVLLIKEHLLVNRGAKFVQGTPYQFVDAGIAGEHFCLAATEMGLGTCWVGWYDGRAVIRHLGLRSKGYRPIALLAVGYPAAGIEPRESRRKPLDGISSWNRPPG
jgi:nitroreductase